MDKVTNRKNSKDLPHLDMDTSDAASSMDFTGLIPANPKSDEELSSYKTVHEFGRDAVKDIQK